MDLHGQLFRGQTVDQMSRKGVAGGMEICILNVAFLQYSLEKVLYYPRFNITGIPYILEGVEPPTAEQIELAERILIKAEE